MAEYVQEVDGVEVLAFVLWIMLALFCFYLYHQACFNTNSDAEETEPPIGLFHAPHEYAVVVDPSGSIRIGVKLILSKGMGRVKSIASSISSWGRVANEYEDLIVPDSESDREEDNRQSSLTQALLSNEHGMNGV